MSDPPVAFVDRPSEWEPPQPAEVRASWGSLAARMRVYTARMGEYRGRDALNVTRGARDELGVLFAPSWRLLRPYLDARRDGVLTESHWHDYTRGFLDEMRASWKREREQWLRVLKRRELTFLCFCTDVTHCHRLLLATQVFPSFGATYEGERPPTVKVAGRW